MVGEGASVLAGLEDLFRSRGAEDYFGEPVTIAGHMLQCAALARSENASDVLIAAALLHDIGHLMSPGAYSSTDVIDHRHEQLGAAFLAQAFPASIVEAIRLHVDAKRYLCATDPAYCGKLSSASQHSLQLQGGPMEDREIARFRAATFYREALQVRLWDDAGKQRDRAVPAFADFGPILRSVML